MGADKGSAAKGSAWPGSSSDKVCVDEHGTYLEVSPRSYVLLAPNEKAPAGGSAATPEAKGKSFAKGNPKGAAKGSGTAPPGGNAKGSSCQKGASASKGKLAKGQAAEKGSGPKGSGKAKGLH